MLANKSREDFRKYLENEDFFYFIAQEFKDVSRHATMEELAEFAFGSLQDAIDAFKESKN